MSNISGAFCLFLIYYKIQRCIYFINLMYSRICFQVSLLYLFKYDSEHRTIAAAKYLKNVLDELCDISLSVIYLFSYF